MARPHRRFTGREVKSGPFKGSIHIASTRHLTFIGQLELLRSHLSHTLLPTDPEDLAIQGILVLLQNLLEYESEILIALYTQKATSKERKFQQQIDRGYVSFKAKMDWLLARRLIGKSEWKVMEEVRRLRNAYAHSRPTERRTRYRYRGFPLLTNRSIKRLFVDTELVLRVIRSGAGRQSQWMIVPPAYASEMGWSAADIKALEG